MRNGRVWLPFKSVSAAQCARLMGRDIWGFFWCAPLQFVSTAGDCSGQSIGRLFFFLVARKTRTRRARRFGNSAKWRREESE